MGREPTEDDIVFGLLFMAVCNIALYGTVSYLVLSTLSLLRNRPVTNDPPPPPVIQADK